jgi:hypothetical protein
MPYFLQPNDLYRILQRESPPNLYPDGQPSQFFSTADQYSVASVLGDAYANQEEVYDNYFPTVTVDNLPDFEFLYFGYNLDSTLTIDQRRVLLLNKIRTKRRTTPQDIIDVIYTIIDPSIPVEILEWNGNFNGTRYGAWILGVSTLGIDTFLSGRAPIYGAQLDKAPLDCDLDVAAAGITEEDLINIQDTAFTYTVNIGVTLDVQTLTMLDSALNAAEGASRRHFINASAGYLLEEPDGGYVLDDSGGKILDG